MKISYNWLKDYLECGLTPEEVAQALTSIGLEVDGVEQVEEIPGGLAGVIVAEVVECVDHPDSDHLHVTKLNTAAVYVKMQPVQFYMQQKKPLGWQVKPFKLWVAMAISTNSLQDVYGVMPNSMKLAQVLQRFAAC